MFLSVTENFLYLFLFSYIGIILYVGLFLLSLSYFKVEKISDDQLKDVIDVCKKKKITEIEKGK